MPFDPFVGSTGLDAAKPVAGLDPFASDLGTPVGPGAAGWRTGIAGIKSAGYGLKALAARAVGAPTVEAQALADAQAQEDAVAPLQRRVEDVDSVGSAYDFAKYALGQAIPSTLLMAGGGVLGRVAGGLIAKRLATEATKNLVKQAGLVGGAYAGSLGLEVGSIFPDAVQEGVDNPALRSIGGGSAAAALDVIAPGYLARKAGLLGPVAEATRKAGFGAVARGTVAEAGKVAVFEGLTEAAQEAIERAAAGKALADAEAKSAYLNAGAIGALAGGVIGGGVGALEVKGRPIEQPPVLSNQQQVLPETQQPLPAIYHPDDMLPPVEVVPLQKGPSAPAGGPAPGPIETPFRRAEAPVAEDADLTRHENLTAQREGIQSRLASLEAELALPQKERTRTKSEIVQERNRTSLALTGTERELANVSQALRNRRALAETPNELGPRAPSAEGVSLKPSLLDTTPAETAVAQIKRREGMLVSSREARLVPKMGTIVPKLGTVEERASRERVRYVDEQTRQGAIETATVESIKRHITELAAAGGFRKGTALRTKNQIIEAARAAKDAPTIEDAQRQVREAAIKALGGNVNKADAETFADSVAADIAKAPSFYSRGAVSEAAELMQQAEAKRTQAVSLRKRAERMPAERRSVHEGEAQKLEREATWLGFRAETLSNPTRYSKGAAQPGSRARWTEGQEYEGRLFGGAYDSSRVEGPRGGMAAKDAPMRKAIMQARERYNGVRKEFGLEPVTDWATRPAREQLIQFQPAPLESRATQDPRAAYEAWTREVEAVEQKTGPAKRAYLADMNIDRENVLADKSVKDGSPEYWQRMLEAGKSALQFRAEEQKVEVPRSLLSKGASDGETVQFTHWGNVPGGQLDPGKHGTGIAGADVKVAKQAGVSYTSAVVKGSEYTEPRVQAGKQYEGSIPAERVYTARSDDPILAQERAKLQAEGIHNDALAWARYTKAVKDLGYDAMLYARGQLRIFTPQAVRESQPATVNIGLATNDGAGVTVPEVLAVLQRTGARVLQHSTHQSDTEQTLVAQLSRPLTPAEATTVSAMLRQEAIAQIHEGEGDLYGPKADAWRPFNPAFFLMPDGKRADATTVRSGAQGRAIDQYHGVLAERGERMVAHLKKLIGEDPGLEVKLTAVTPGELTTIGSYTRVNKYKSVISLALNAKNELSLADHEGFHYLEDQKLDPHERAVIRSALRPGSALYKTVIERAQAYDRAHKTEVADEIASIPEEARAYAFEFWRRGELKADSALSRVFEKIRNLLERIVNFIRGEGFQSIEDIFSALDKGEMVARARTGQSALYPDLLKSQAAPGTWYYSALAKQVSVLQVPEGGWTAEEWKTRILEPESKRKVGVRDEKNRVLRDAAGQPVSREVVTPERVLLPDVKREEIEATGLMEWLEIQKGKVSKQAVRGFLERNGVQVEETTLGAMGKRHMDIDERAQGMFSANYDDLTSEQARAVRAAQEEAGTPNGPPKFGQYTLPGGENYRELLLRLPVQSKYVIERRDKVVGGKTLEMYAVVNSDTLQVWRTVSTIEAAENIAREGNAQGSVGKFQSTHFDQPNILAHVRFNERTDADGKRVLFIEEFQSDWAQKGKKDGFAIPANIEGWTVVKAEGDPASGPIWAVRDANQRWVLGVPRVNVATGADAIAYAATRNSKRTSLVPVAPFVTKTEAWVALSLKRMIRYAAENGFDRVAWTTGEQQVERYRDALRKAVDSIEWTKTAEGVHLVGYKGTAPVSNSYERQLAGDAIRRNDMMGFEGVTEALDSIWDHRNDWENRWGDGLGDTDQAAINNWIDARLSPSTRRNKVVDTTEQESALSDAIGKAMADKIRNDPAQSGVIEGEALTVSDTGMSGFYDRIVPSVANEVLRKLGGGKVRDVLVDEGKGEAGLQEFERRFFRDEGRLPTDDERDGYFPTLKQPGFDITPLLAQRAAEGLPLFSRAAAAPVDELMRRFQAGELETEQQRLVVADFVDQAKSNTATMRQAFGAGLEGAAGGMKRWLLENVTTGNYTARYSNGYKNVLGALSTYMRRKQTLISEGSLSGLSAWHQGSTNQPDITAVGRVLLQRTERGLLAGSPELTALTASLTTHQRDMFNQATKVIAGRLQHEFEVEKGTMSTLLPAAEYAKWESNRATQVRKLQAEGYVPERRYGDYTVYIYKDVVDAKGRPQRLTMHYEQFENQAVAKIRTDQYKAILAREAPELKVDLGYRHRVERDASISIQQFLDTARRHGIDLTQAEKERLAKALVAADSVRRNRIFRRKNIPGYSEDIMRVLHEFVVTTSNKIAYAEFSTTINDAVVGRPVDTRIEQGVVRIDQDRTRNLWDEDDAKSQVKQAGYFRNIADSLVDYVLVPDHTGTWSKTLRGVAMMYFLGGSLASGAVNAMSMPMNTVPWLSQYTPYTNAFARSMSAWGTTVKNAGVLRDLAKLQDLNNKLPEIDNVPGLRRALITAAEDGRTLDTEIHQIMGISQGGMFAQSRRVQKAIQGWMLPFRFAEQTNRIATFIAAYKIGQENKLAERALYEFAAGAVDNTQNRYDEVNRPGLARHPVWALLFMFKSFPIFTLEMLHIMYQQSPKSAVYMLLGLVALAGVNGLPFAETIMDLVDTFSQRVFKSGFNTRRVMRNVLKEASEMIVGVDLSDVLLRGTINSISGLNVASRVGMGDFVPGTRLGAADNDYARTMQQILGAPISMLTDVIGTADKLAKGQFYEALRAGGPSAARNAIKGYEQLDRGFAVDAKGQKLVDVSGPYAFWQAAGFSSAALAKAYDMDRIDKQTDAFYTQVRQDFTSELVKAIVAGNTEKATEIMVATQKWNEANPDMPVMLAASAVRRHVVEAGMPLNERTLRNLPRQLRGTSLAIEGVNR